MRPIPWLSKPPNVPPTILSVTTVEPIAVAGSPVTLKVSATDAGGATLTYAFDFNNDGDDDVSNTTGQATFTFPADGTYPVNIQVSDGNGGVTTTTINIQVLDVIPVLALTSTPAQPVVNAGTPLQLNLSFADADNQVVQSYMVNWGDGAIETFHVNGSAGLNPTHVYSSGDITPTILVFNVATAKHVYGVLGTLNATVNDAAPTIALSGASQVIQGLPYMLTFGDVTDPGTEEVTGYTVYWGDNSFDTFAGSPASGGTVDHIYAATGQQNIEVSLIDRDGTHPDAGQLAVNVLADQPACRQRRWPLCRDRSGGIVVLDATQSNDPDQAGSSLTYAWDFSGNGQFTDATGPNPTFSAAGLDWSRAGRCSAQSHRFAGRIQHFFGCDQHSKCCTDRKRLSQTTGRSMKARRSQ